MMQSSRGELLHYEPEVWILGSEAKMSRMETPKG